MKKRNNVTSSKKASSMVFNPLVGIILALIILLILLFVITKPFGNAVELLEVIRSIFGAA